MATAKARRQITFTLELSQEEAQFIADLTQNSLYANGVQEPAEQEALRCSIFEAIRKASEAA